MNPFLTQIVESPHMTEAFEDWSRVRSPARAARRLKFALPEDGPLFAKGAA